MRVALVLGSGGARGYAHIGAIRALESAGHEVIGVSGASMGALVGGLYAAGQLDPYTEWVSGLRQRDVLRMLDVKLSSPGIIAAGKIVDKLDELAGDIDIEALPIPYTAVASDIDSRREVWFQRGPLVTAVRASISIPGVLTPVRVHGRLLADGGLLNPVPIDPVAASPAELTVAISLSGPRAVDAAHPGLESFAPIRRAGLGDRLRSALGNVVERDQPDPDEPSGMVDVVTRSLDAMQAIITRYRLAANPPDVLVTVPINACGTLDFHRADEMIDLGERLMTEALHDLG